MYVGRFNLWKQSQKSYNQQIISIRLRFHSMIMVKRPTYVVHVFKYLFIVNKTRCKKEWRELYDSKSGTLNSLDNVKYLPNLTQIQ